MNKTRKYLFAIILISLILFWPSLSTFYTNDDFFLLKISQAHSFGELINFFNLTAGPDGLGMYRPLTTQAFYFLGWKLFNLNPFGLHIISLLVFFAVIFLVYKFCLLLLTTHKSPFTNHISLLAAFLYATSATHFGHLYYLATFQELGLALFFLLSLISFMRFLDRNKLVTYVLSFVTFVLSLLSKETAVILPLIQILVYWFFRSQKRKVISVKKFLLLMAPYSIVLGIYFYMRFAHYGFAAGDSYIWDFSIKRVINTVGWYALWSFNLPEMLVDFVGPGFHFNPNLFKFWSREIIPIFALFSLQILVVVYLILKSKILNLKSLITFCFFWFLITLLPVLFLPLHKFTFYLTLPLIGLVVFISFFLTLSRQKLISIVFMTVWLMLSIATLNLTSKTHWITRGAQTAKNVHNYLMQNFSNKRDSQTIGFYDSEVDKDLPWNPSNVLRVVLSDNNYFKVFWGSKLSAGYYTSASEVQGDIKIKARGFLGY